MRLPKMPFVSRKRHDAMASFYITEINRLKRCLSVYGDQAEADIRKLEAQVRDLREALFHKKRADNLEGVILRGIETSPKATFVPSDGAGDET